MLQSDSLLALDCVCCAYGNGVPVLHDISFDVSKGELLGLVGESGCGKTTLVKCILGLLPRGASITSGRMYFHGLPLDDKTRRDVRGRRIAFMPQDAGTALNDIRRVKNHFRDVMGRCSDAQIIDLLERVHLHDARSVLNSYPFELSGGMKQRVLMALSLSRQPELLIADEPTSSIDAPLRREVLRELVRLKDEEGMTLIVITHDLREIESASNRTIVMHDGRIVESGATEEIFRNPQNEYTRLLMQFSDMKYSEASQ